MTNVLYVEDEPNDVMLLRLACEKAGVSFGLEDVADGEQAIAWLGGCIGRADFRRASAPALVLLDLKLPRLSGFEVLKWIRAQPEFELLPVIIFTSSVREEDIDAAYRLGATAYLGKPAQLKQLLELVKTIDCFWIQLNRTPGEERNPG